MFFNIFLDYCLFLKEIVVRLVSPFNERKQFLEIPLKSPDKTTTFTDMPVETFLSILGISSK